MEEIINRVAQSGLVTLNLEDYYPKEETATFDIKDFLFRGLILKEKDYRTVLQELDWSLYAGKNVAVTCSADAIIPVWAYMLPVTYLQPVAKNVVPGDEQFLLKTLYLRNISGIDPEGFRDQRVIIKGCGNLPVPAEAYAEVTRLLRPVAKSILYGEACSNIPIFKKKAQDNPVAGN
jgi:hypothetical protein